MILRNLLFLALLLIVGIARTMDNMSIDQLDEIGVLFTKMQNDLAENTLSANLESAKNHHKPLQELADTIATQDDLQAIVNLVKMKPKRDLPQEKPSPKPTKLVTEQDHKNNIRAQSDHFRININKTKRSSLSQKKQKLTEQDHKDNIKAQSSRFNLFKTNKS